MSNFVGKHAIVIGAGIGGLTAAKALSYFFEKVTVLERDILPSQPEARTGTPQSRQVHVLLAGGLNALKEFFSDIENDLEDAGAVRARVGSQIRLELPGFDPFPRRDLEFHTSCMTRPLLEFVIRRRVEQHSNILLQSSCRVIQLVASPDQTSIIGVRFDRASGDREMLLADLVVDASSRGTVTLELLDRIAVTRPEETEIGIDLSYATTTFEMSFDTTRDWLAVIHRPDAKSGRGGFLFPIENNRWHVNLNGVHGDAPTGDIEEYIAFAKSLRTPTIYDAIKGATPLGSIHRFVLPSSVRRRFERLKNFPAGLIPIGDVICRFNPAFGQGMSVAAQEASALKNLLESRRGVAHPLGGLAPAFFSAIQDILDAPWSVAEMDFIYTKTRGKCPADLPLRVRYGRALQQIAAEDAVVHRVWGEVANLVKPPSALRDPSIVSRVTALMAASDHQNATSP